MAETDSTIPKPPLPEPAVVPTKVVPGTGAPAKKERVAIAVSEENLAALLGPEPSGGKPVMPGSAGEVPSMLALLSQVQEKQLPEPAPPAPAAPLTETLGSTLALLATIKENRALMRSKPPAPPAAIPPEPAKEALEPAAPDAPRSRVTVFPASAPPPAPIPQWAMPRPSSPSRLAAALDKLPGGRKSLLILGTVIAVGGVSAGLVVRNQRTAKASTVALASLRVVAPAVPPTNAFPLQLQADLQGNGSINLRWNPGSPLIAQAREGRLVITETNQKPQTVAVSLEQLRLGYLTYQPRSERVDFRLEVVDQSGSIAEESALALNPPATGKTESARPSQTSAPQTPEATASAAPPSRPASRIFTPPSTQPAQELRAIVDIPPALPNIAVPSLGTSGHMPGPIAPPSAPPAPAPVPAVRQIQVATSLQAANLIKRVAPEYPPFAKSAHLEGTVRFKALIGADGAIRNLEVLSGPPLLRPAALAAVRQWLYKPTLLNGQPLEVVTQIEVSFTLGK